MHDDLSREIQEQHALIAQLREELGKVVVGQQDLVDRVIIGLLCRGHILLEGVPGLAKTLLVKTLAACLRCGFKRISFTPDLLPADLLGTEVYEPQSCTFTIKKGPLFQNVLLADEVNRAPSKVQSALLEAMQERQITIAGQTFALPDPFLVLATQNPIEQEGTYPLPEAQVDRFLLKLVLHYPSRDEEREIVRRYGSDAIDSYPQPQPVLGPEDLARLHRLVGRVHMDDKLMDYLLDLVRATRQPGDYGLADMARHLEFGASPRASLALAITSRAHAFLQGRGYVTPQDIKSVGPDVLRHRLILSYEAEAEDLSADAIVQRIFDAVEVP